MQDELESGYLDYRDNISANGGNAWVAPVGLAFEHIHDKIVAEGGTPTNSGNTFYNLYTGTEVILRFPALILLRW